jgi:UDP-2,4-diacetamido-2,4,6-trideoxy-beta-L-altropyranose hydrolase
MRKALENLRLEKPGHLVVCAECGVWIGTGHVMRCLALGQAWKRAGGSVTFVIREGLPSSVEARLRREGIVLQTLAAESTASPEDFIEAARSLHPSVAVLDGYGFGAPEQAMLSELGIRVLTVDDYGHASSYPVHWLLNQNAYARAAMYSPTDATLLLGPAHALLRDEFSPWLGWKRRIPERAGRILITIGGSDPENVSERVLRGLALLKGERGSLEVVLVVGGGNPHGKELTAAAENCALAVRIEKGIDDMPARMAWADIAIAGAGGTSYELCYMGLPALLLIIAENQKRSAQCLSELGMAVNAGTSREFDATVFAGQLQEVIESAWLRQGMSSRARALVDGLGSERVRAALMDRSVALRPARESDCRLLFEWARNATARAASFHSADISWEGHERWFAERLKDPASVVYLGERIPGEPVGVVRYQIDGERAVVSVNVAEQFRGQGWGRELIALSTRCMVRTRAIRAVDAFVKPGNQASIGLFEASGFRRNGIEQVAGQEALRLSWQWEAGTDVR